MSATTNMLEKNGWVRYSRRKLGMVIIAKWWDRKSNQIFSQGNAVRIQRDRNKMRRESKHEISKGANTEAHSETIQEGNEAKAGTS